MKIIIGKGPLERITYKYSNCKTLIVCISVVSTDFAIRELYFMYIYIVYVCIYTILWVRYCGK